MASKYAVEGRQDVDAPNEGWKWLYNTRKWHYFKADGKSLCGKWMRLSRTGLETGNNESADNCAECKRRILSDIVEPRTAALREEVRRRAG